MKGLIDSKLVKKDAPALHSFLSSLRFPIQQNRKKFSYHEKLESSYHARFIYLAF